MEFIFHFNFKHNLLLINLILVIELIVKFDRLCML